MASHPRPHFFLSRPDHTITPLIAVDELPDHIRIDGVPATLSQADTQAMMSLGVKERSTRHYDVQIIKSTSVSSSSHEGPIKHTGASGSGPSLNGSVEISLLRTSGKEKEHIEENTADSSSIEVIQRPDLAGEEGETVTVTKAAHGEDEELRSAGVEEWRQKVKVSETQARIDAVLAAHNQRSNSIREEPGDEDNREARREAGFVPGKKVYCSHWIRTGECDFQQQGCLYKHEMPDDDTLNAIGVRSIPAWYIAAHPMKARERGFGRGSGAADRIWGARREPFPATGPNSSQMPFRTQPPVFHQPSASRFTSKPSAEFFGAPSGYSSNFMRPPFVSPVGQHAVFDRVNGLPDQTQPQYHYTACSRGMELAIMRKPPKPKTPGYNTHPFQLPPPPSPQDSATVPELEKPQLKPVPVWEPRQSKLSNALVHRAGHSTSTMNKDGAAAQGQGQTSVQLEKDDAKLDTSTPSATDGEKQQLKVDDAISHHPPPSHSTVYHPASATPTSLRTRPSAINVAYPSLQPSLPLQSTSAALPSRERQSSVSSDLFALAPKTPAPPHRRLFVAPGEERYVTEAEEPQAIKVRPSVNDQGGSLRFQERAQKPYRKERQVGGNGKADRLKNLLDNNVNKKRVFSPEKTPRGKQAVKEGGQSKELLVDI